MRNNRDPNGKPIPRSREAWQKPGFRRIGADEAQTGIDFGPEILILLS